MRTEHQPSQPAVWHWLWAENRTSIPPWLFWFQFTDCVAMVCQPPPVMYPVEAVSEVMVIALKEGPDEYARPVVACATPTAMKTPATAVATVAVPVMRILASLLRPDRKRMVDPFCPTRSGQSDRCRRPDWDARLGPRPRRSAIREVR